MMRRKQLAWRLRVAMEMAEISTQELAYEAGVPTWAVYKCRDKSGKLSVSPSVWSALFGAIEGWAPGTLRMLNAAEEAMNG